MTDAHACPGYTCDRPECVRRQRDELLAAIVPREPTNAMLRAGMRQALTADTWLAMYDAALAEKEGK